MDRKQLQKTWWKNWFLEIKWYFGTGKTRKLSHGIVVEAPNEQPLAAAKKVDSANTTSESGMLYSNKQVTVLYEFHEAICKVIRQINATAKCVVI